MHETTTQQTLATLVTGLLVGAVALWLLGGAPGTAASDEGTEMTGYAWSDTVGWISFNCLDEGVCGSTPYSVTIQQDGALNGYAWSDNVGWITARASDVSGCPSGPCPARIEDGELKGWMRALSADDAESGGWDGWISLNGASYGPEVHDNGTLSGYAWGSDVVGWVDFSQVQYAACTPSYSCSGTSTILYTNALCQTSTHTTCESPGYCVEGSSSCAYPSPEFAADGELSVVPQLVRASSTTVVSWDTDNTESCSVTGTNGDAWSGSSGSHTSSPITGPTTYTLACTGYDDSTLEDSASVRLVPAWQEF